MKKQLSIFTLTTGFFIASILFLLYGVEKTGLFYLSYNHFENSDTSRITNGVTNRKILSQIELKNEKLAQKLRSLTPRDPFIIINTTYNRFRLFRNQKLVRQGFCSTGSFILLKGHDKREWIFQTPKGCYSIQGKVTSPVWWRPDWSFVEEGLPVPPRNDHSRWESGVLGDYALSIGNGYLIHGTLYKRFLGMPVTHGCIRMNDDDLEAVYKILDIGSKVYIY